MIDQNVQSANGTTDAKVIKISGRVRVSFEKPTDATVEIQAKLPNDPDNMYRTIRTMSEDSEVYEGNGPVALRAKVTAGSFPVRILIRS